jgi:predicted GNAT family acetyltransferase
MDINETFVASELRGRGHAKDLLDSAVEYARDYGFLIRASSPVARNYLTKTHPDILEGPADDSVPNTGKTMAEA